MGVDQVSLHLLQNQEHGHKDQGLHGGDHQQEESTQAAADEGPHNGDQGGDGDGAAHQHGVGHVQNGHDDEEHGAQDHRLGALAGDEGGEDPVAEGEHLHHLVGPFPGQKSIEGLAALEPQLLLLQEEITGEEKGDEGVRHAVEHIHGGGESGGEDAGGAALDDVHHLIDQGLPVDGLPVEGQGVQPLHDLGGVGEHLLGPVQEPQHSVLDGDPQPRHCPHQLRSDDQHQNQNHQHHKQERQQQAHRPQKPPDPAAGSGLAPGCWEQLRLNEAHRHVQYKGHGPAGQEGCQQVQQEYRRPGRPVEPLKSGKGQGRESDEQCQFFHGLSG